MAYRRSSGTRRRGAKYSSKRSRSGYKSRRPKARYTRGKRRTSRKAPRKAPQELIIRFEQPAPSPAFSGAMMEKVPEEMKKKNKF